MNCPNDPTHPLDNWSIPGQMQFGNACLTCRLFIWQTPADDRTWVTHSQPLEHVPMPPGFERIPVYREALGWKDAHEIAEERLRTIIREEIDAAIGALEIRGVIP